MKNLNAKIDELESLIKQLESKVQQIDSKLTATTFPNASMTMGGTSFDIKPVCDLDSGLSSIYPGPLVWNNAELQLLSEEIDLLTTPPTAGYFKHSHGDYSGGAIDINTLMLVEYERAGVNVQGKDNSLPPHSQSHWDTEALVKKVDKETITYKTVPTNSGNQIIFDKNKVPTEKKGLLDLVYNPQVGKWGCSAYEIDVSKCYFVMRNPDGQLKTDSKGHEMKSLIYITKPESQTGTDGSTAISLNADSTKTSLVWDEIGRCWRYYSVFAPTPPETTRTAPGTVS